MRLVYKDVGHVLRFGEGSVNELVVENKKLFFEMVNSIFSQIDGLHGNFLLSIKDTPVEFSRYADETVQFAPFHLNRKSLLTKLYTALERNALQAEYYTKTNELLCKLESYIHTVSDDFPFEVVCKKLTIGQVIKALSPEIEEDDKTTLEKIFAYMELVRELDRDRLFIMVNMRSYFSDSDMENFIQTVCLHDFNVLLLESSSAPLLKNTKRFTVDDDLCEF